ncbi:hypothetical protein EV174_003302 [Coemansia sp. RSA 2320]|nr:hypothetical protein EV174_003302 [Coemansia sp. RSA 2320]
MVYYASLGKPALTPSKRTLPCLDSDAGGLASSAEHAHKSYDTQLQQFCHPGNNSHTRSRGPTRHSPPDAAQWVVPVFAKPYNEAANRTSIPASPAQATAAVTTACKQHKSLAVAAVALQRAARGRVDKRKSRCPTRSPPGLDSLSSSATAVQQPTHVFHTVKMAFIDEYQRNPTAYSRALMDSERSGTHDSRSRSGSSHPPLQRLSSHNAGLSNMARGGNSALRLSTSVPAAHPRLMPPARTPALRKSLSATIMRLFPSLCNPESLLVATAAAASQAKARSTSPNSELPAPLNEEYTHHMDVCYDSSSHPYRRRQLQPAPVPVPARDLAPSPRATSTTCSGASTPQSNSSSDKPSEDYPDILNLDDKLSREIFELRPSTNSCSVKWTKAAPMDVSGYPMAELLAVAEKECCSTLRLFPEQYLAIKQSLVRAGRTLPKGKFKKRDAQKLCRVDVNKTSKVFEWFCKLQWIPQASKSSNHAPSQADFESSDA